jgi:hypothetical protein
MTEIDVDGGSPPGAAKKTPFWVPIAVFFGALPAVLALFIFGFIFRYGWAHDEDRCPFHEVETRVVEGSVSVREDARRCLDEVEEHRWLVVRGDAEPLDLGRYPLEAELVETGFPWEARLEDGRVVIDVTNEGRGTFTLREPAERE